ncbi:M14 family metallopeptidase [Nocardiopsis ansamitocini]|uniref:Zinc carboxypeptidase n=1 Tax=Nocardiopsis ansamitocini TaxID=1670832 RepID=A0A9W6UJA9_9ACTN|nr:M14 family metallopeptidase [Nocardiopsis ansamitocini]GLU48542.1 carboxypeptidase T [Nocardiopsis ansamitocini]
MRAPPSHPRFLEALVNGRRRLLTALTLAALVLSGGATAGAHAEDGAARPGPPAQYRVDGPATAAERTEVARTGAAIDGVDTGSVQITATSAEVRAIEALGFEVSPLLRTLDFPPSDSAYHNYAEMVARIDKAVADHPTLVRKTTFGTSHEGRNLLAVKISANVATDQNEPEVLFFHQLHAREHLTVEMGLYLIDLLSDGYGNDAQITRLLNSREIWVLPSLNPDGSEYDIATGSYRSWRKNRQPNSGTTAVGTDLNRNFAYLWGCCNGSSGSPSSTTYRGPRAESSPEVRALSNFVRGRVVGGKQQIRVSIDFHTYGQLILWPYGYTYAETATGMTRDDYDTHAALGRRMAALNGYTPQQSSDLYITDGSSTDWLWANQKIFAFTYEMYPGGASGGGFYPPGSIINRETSRNRGAVLELVEYADCPQRVIGKQAQYCA